MFVMPHQAYPALEETAREIKILNKLYNIYCKVIETVGGWRSIPLFKI